MEFSIKTILLFASCLLVGLSAGFFYAWSVSVIPGTRKILDTSYLETMQKINRAILNPGFFIIFFISLLALVVTTIFHFQPRITFQLLLMSTIIYGMGTIGITMLGNVPLNNQLDVLNLEKMSSVQLHEFRMHYELKWNRLHTIRTIAAVLAFALSIAAIISTTKTL